MCHDEWVPQDAQVAYIRFVALGRYRTFVFAHALRRHLKCLGVNSEIVEYRRASAQSSFLNEVDVAAHLDVETWREIAAWSSRRFGSLHVDAVITGQLEKFSRYGATGEEPYEKTVA
jgi:hypothetical protein